MRVTSNRLGRGEVANRWFPKIRSWFALGAPLELLSPLSVGRVCVIVSIVTWTAGLVLGGPVLVTASLLAISVAGLFATLRMTALRERHGPVLLSTGFALTMVSALATGGSHRVQVLGPLLGILALYGGLFGRPRRFLPGAVAASVALLTVVRFTNQAVGIGDGVTLTVFCLLLGSMIALTVRTSRLAGLIDPDTGLMNARGLEYRVSQRRLGDEMLIATVHLRGVAEVREALGNQAGTELVRRAVEDLGQVLPTNALVGRSGDDLIVLLAHDAVHARSLDDMTASTVRQIESALGLGRYTVGDIEVALNVHIGTVTTLSEFTALDRAAPGDAPLDRPIVGDAATVGPLATDAHSTGTLSGGELLRQSALAARSARDAGRSVSTWNGESTTLTADDLAILASLRTAAERGELWVAYQPQVRTPDGRTVAAEALLRWSSAEHGLVPPGRFIPLAERTGFVDRLTDWVLAEALDAQQRWRQTGLDITVSVNVSPLSLRSVDFADRVMALLDARQLPADVLMLEVTESVAFDVPEAVERLAPLRERGVGVSIDDFGTGYTSLAILPRLPLDELKVDQQFVREAASSPASEAIVRSVCELGHRLGLTVVAEGVEDAYLADLMTTFGFDLLQGYHFARPMPEDELVARLLAQDDFSHLEPVAVRTHQ
jgi:diguanylate cyclase